MHAQTNCTVAHHTHTLRGVNCLDERLHIGWEDAGLGQPYSPAIIMSAGRKFNFGSEHLHSPPQVGGQRGIPAARFIVPIVVAPAVARQALQRRQDDSRRPSPGGDDRPSIPRSQSEPVPVSDVVSQQAHEQAHVDQREPVAQEEGPAVGEAVLEGGQHVVYAACSALGSTRVPPHEVDAALVHAVQQAIVDVLLQLVHLRRGGEVEGKTRERAPEAGEAGAQDLEDAPGVVGDDLGSLFVPQDRHGETTCVLRVVRRVHLVQPEGLPVEVRARRAGQEHPPLTALSIRDVHGDDMLKASKFAHGANTTGPRTHGR
mmetsp:Transcript_17299/g.46158  ORF Transcript_17299/g.46158 Transcript_17299/m.46158 type:complete len:316 (-) Transcript_17299:1300-2247(-)